MTGAFSTVNPDKCRHYAEFMQHLGREEADIMFWTLFVFVILLLITASTMYTKTSETLLDTERGSLENTAHRRVRCKCLFISLVCFLLAVVAVILEAFAAFKIQFCDGEDLMMLYWGFWSLIQVGSLIAIFGIILNQWYCLENKDLPPWNVALGTPVLVIAALGHAWESYVSAKWRKWRGKGDNGKSTRSKDTTSRREVILPFAQARFVGKNEFGETLFAFPVGFILPMGVGRNEEVSQNEESLNDHVNTAPISEGYAAPELQLSG